ncbi:MULTISPECIES: DUF2917 domain-containing protein [unclassified Caballeronia]|uniref:DUF2917 domain-containing protein n=1 Tax=unclassified Caballeronia TaxID=2646786 RepID=UPI00285480A7|nr:MULTISPECIES: DUF2917 domain-containing protein [unclassified Caballeronia]MDR5771483.1 DUF2917 domain-containing protein [Caballeronia sp. LZ002]MDR5846919.1 DUF2917 domain-containing protein [Caballeronia sp. LZ003]
MEEGSKVLQRGVLHGVAAGKLDASGARVVVYVEVAPHQTVSWRLARDADLRITDASVWLTRHQDPYDYWMKPGDIVRLKRGECVWLSSESEHAVEVSLTSYRKNKARTWARILARFMPRAANATSF